MSLFRTIFSFLCLAGTALSLSAFADTPTQAPDGFYTLTQICLPDVSGTCYSITDSHLPLESYINAKMSFSQKTNPTSVSSSVCFIQQVPKSTLPAGYWANYPKTILNAISLIPISNDGSTVSQTYDQSTQTIQVKVENSQYPSNFVFVFNTSTLDQKTWNTVQFFDFETGKQNYCQFPVSSK